MFTSAEKAVYDRDHPTDAILAPVALSAVAALTIAVSLFGRD